MRTAWAALSRLHRALVGAVCGGVVLLGIVVFLHWKWERSIRDAAKRSADSTATAIQFDAALRIAHADAQRIRAERALVDARIATDSLLTASTRQGGRVQNIAHRVHDTVRVAFPVVDTLVVASLALADSLPRLVAAVQTERAAVDSLTSVVARISADAMRQAAALQARVDRLVKDAAGSVRAWLATLLAALAGLGGYLLAAQR